MRKNDPYRDNKKLRRAKKFSVATSTTSGLLGIGALGALGASRAPHLVNPALRTHKRVLQAQKIGQDATLPLTATSLGVGGVGSLNFAAVQNREANRIKTKRNVRKSMDTPMMDFGLSGVRQGRSVLLPREVTKAYTPYDPEARRKRRLDGYATGLAATAGAAGGGAGVYGAQARQSYRAGRAAANEYSDLARRTARARPNIDSSPNIGAAKASVRAFNEGQDALASRAKSALETANRSRKAAKVKGGRSAALGAAGVGALVGADQVRRYRNRGGRSWNTRNWDQD